MSEKKNESTPATDDKPDAREQMRLALERKKAGNHGGASHADGSSKASSATTNAKVQREFRRKSGG